MVEWVIFDYGVGNLHSLQKALARAGANARITESPEELVAADIAVLPGVGAFGHVMQRLEPAAEGLRQRHRDGKPILGVCIGMQVMYESSDEAGDPGLGIIEGHVARLPADAGKIPHMGWNTITGQVDGYVYYVHSYAAYPSAETTATTTYGTQFSAAIESGNTIGFQFHPEKSGDLGARILGKAVAKLEAACR